MSDLKPLLRSPPFPGIPAHVAAVSQSAEPRVAGAIADGQIDRLFARLRQARVGGSFWAVPPPRRNGEVEVQPIDVLLPRSAAECGRMLADIGMTLDQRTAIVLLPRERWAIGVARVVRRSGLPVVVGECDPWPLLTPANRVHAHGDDELAALALVAGIALRLLSDGPYATREGVAAALAEGCAYRDPFTDEATPIDLTIDLLAGWRREIDANRTIVAAAGIAHWKRQAIARFLWAPRERRFAFRSERRSLGFARHAGAGIAIWPSRVSSALPALAAADAIPIVRLEDGFIRSVGLGSSLFPPFSIVLDRRGIHYDPSAPSDLETLLETGDFPQDILNRAEALRRAIVAAGISKYGAATERAPIPHAVGRRRILVAGQVEDDMSVRLGGGGVAGNRDLLARARALEPDAEIWFRPHPDVDAGHRIGRIDDARALRLADRVVRGGGMATLLDAVDGVHVLTSLTGFEALLRGRDVIVHGLPFYAGWGLTRDLAATPTRRARRLTLAELIAGTLILYPRYCDPITLLPCPPETLIARFAGGARPRATWLTGPRAVQGQVMRAIGLRR